MTQDDALFRFRKREISLAEEIGVSAACRAMGIHRSTYYRWRAEVLRFGLVDHPGELVQMNCFSIGRLSGAKGTCWQYTAIDVASGYMWAELHLTPKNPSARWTSALARRVAKDLSARGWELESVTTDNASRFRSRGVRKGCRSGQGAPHLHPGGATAVQRLHRARAEDDSRRVRREISDPQIHRAPARPRSIPAPLTTLTDRTAADTPKDAYPSRSSEWGSPESTDTLTMPLPRS